MSDTENHPELSIALVSNTSSSRIDKIPSFQDRNSFTPSEQPYYLLTGDE